MQTTWRAPRFVSTVKSCIDLHPWVQQYRWLSAQASNDKMVDDMVDFVRTRCQGNMPQALDVLKTGVAHQTGSGRDRLQLLTAEVYANESSWAAVAEHTLPIAQHQAHSDKDALEAQLQMEASLVSTRALLVQGKDDLALKLAKQAVKRADCWLPADGHSETKHQAQLEAHTSLASALHATGDEEGANLQCQTAYMLASHDMPNVPSGSQSSIAAALKQTAALRFAQGNLAKAEELYARASTAVEQKSAETSSRGLRVPDWQQQVAADVLLGAAQTAAAQQAWPQAEELLSKALKVAEQLHGGNDQTPQVGIVLGLLGDVYARSKRITLAEGLHRQAVKLMKLDPNAPTSAARMPVHSILAAAAAWRYAQLLAALPRRSTEASSWMEFAAAQLPKGATAESSLGPLNILKGEADKSTGVVVDMLLLRALPCFRSIGTAD